MATREVEEVYGLEGEEAIERLEKMEAGGEAEPVERGSGRFWVAS